VLEDEMRRLLSLEYDYRFLGTYLKQTVSRTGPRSADSRAVQSVSGTGAGVGAGAGPGAGTGVGAGSERGPGASGINPEFRKRANLGYQELTSALREGRYRTVGEIMFSAYRSLSDDKGAGGRDIDHAATVAYYREVFAILNEHPNEFLRGYYIRRADSHNIGAMLRLRLQGKKRSELAGQYLPFGTLDRSHLEEGFDAALEGFTGMIVFSPLAPALAAVDRNLSPDEQVAAAERRMDERITGYFRDSLVVVFGIEPLFSYLWLKRMELINLRLVIMGRLTGMSPDDIRKHLREY
jgi:vacuolar-type H+-ATPase subunit C/Vma6